MVLPILILALNKGKFIEELFGDRWDDIYGFICIALSFFGLSIRCFTLGYIPKGTSGRNTKKQKAETLNTTGMYSLVRHPLYVGNFFIFLGILLFTEPRWYLFIIMTGAFLAYYTAIMFAEEEFLRKKFGNQFLEWANRTPAFLPRFNNWKAPSLPSSFRHVLRREYTGFFGIIATFTFLDIIGDWFEEKSVDFDPVFAIAFFISALTYVIMRTLKKKTRILHIDGR